MLFTNSLCTCSYRNSNICHLQHINSKLSILQRRENLYIKLVRYKTYNVKGEYKSKICIQIYRRRRRIQTTQVKHYSTLPKIMCIGYISGSFSSYPEISIIVGMLLVFSKKILEFLKFSIYFWFFPKKKIKNFKIFNIYSSVIYKILIKIFDF